MDPMIDSDWLGFKVDTTEETANGGNIARSWQWRERGINPPNSPANKIVLENIAEDILVQKPLKIRCCDLPGYPRSTFLMVFSPDGTKVASTHGNHNVYVSELSSGKHVRILKGHPRTPWCIAFHPSHPQLIGSGCLGGQVRVWDISSGGSEVWNVRSETVIASIAFHPREQLLVIATYNELYFWDWSQPAPFTKVSTNNINEKVRYVAFDSLGYKLITGISLRTTSGTTNASVLQSNTSSSPNNIPNSLRRTDPDDNLENNRPQDNSGSTRDIIVNSYQNLVQRYDTLVRNYQRLFMVRHRLTVTPPPPSTTDRGTDPMETDPAPESNSYTRTARFYSSTPHDEEENLTISNTNAGSSSTSGDGEGASSRLLNLDALSFDNIPSTISNASGLDNSTFGSRQSAFQPLSDNTRRSFRTVDQNERSSRLLPNPFSSTNATPRPSRVSFANSPLINQSTDTAANSSRTSIFPAYSRETSPILNLSSRRLRTNQQHLASAANENVSTETDSISALINYDLPVRETSPVLNLSSRRWTNPQHLASAPIENLSTETDSLSALINYDLPVRETSPVLNLSSRRWTNPQHLASAPNENVSTETDSISALINNDLPVRESSPVLNLSPRRIRNNRQHLVSAPNENVSTVTDSISTLINYDLPSTSTANSTPIPTTANSSTQSQLAAPVDAQTINASLDLIRSILRDSGTRLLNLITNMSLSTLASVERNMPRRRSSSRAHSDDNEGSERLRAARPRIRLFSSSLRNDFLSSSSESDSDQSPEVNIFRTRNSTFREGDISRSTPTGEDTPERLPRSTERLVFELGSRAEHLVQEAGGISVLGNSSRFHVRTQNRLADEEPSTSTRDYAASSSTSTNNHNENNANIDPNRPSTSRDNFWSGGCIFPPEVAYRKVRAGVNVLQRHTIQLTNMWLRGNRITMRELRTMWENLRKRILILYRDTGRQDVSSYYTRSLVERCMMLTDTLNNISRGSSRTSRIGQRTQENNGNTETNTDASTLQNESNSVENEPRISTENQSEPRTTNSNRVPPRHSPTVRSSPSLRRRLHTSYRWRPEDELRRRSRNAAATRLSQRYPNRPRRDFVRAIEISATRHVIRMRAMQVLSVMFNMMMMCLEEQGLNQLIISMLRTLKKALALTCLMLMTNRNGGRSSNTSSSSQRVDSVNVIRLENIDHAGPVNVDGPDESPQNSIGSEPEEDPSRNKITSARPLKREISNKSRTSSLLNDVLESPPNVQVTNHPNTTASQRWSNRLAVQIAAANRNTSATARNRRELYAESKRLRALHRTNPIAHPLIKRKVPPPLSTYRIPALRLLPSKITGRVSSSPRNETLNSEPVAGPSGINLSPDSNAPESSRLPPDMMNEFEHRINLLRRAHMQAVRLRNTARNRFRRLQTIRLYTPSSVREMFTLPPNSESQPENVSSLPTSSDSSNRRQSALQYLNRPHLLARERVFYRGPIRHSGDSGQFHAVISNAAVPLMQVGEPTGSPDNQGNQPQRLPRIHEYLQPIILAQNAMVVDDDANGEGGGGGNPNGGGGGARRVGGMAGLLDAGIISEALPAPSHRVQAWDFTTGETPDIADGLKNVVVQRCRIHNDASIDISKDGRLLVALLPVPRLRNTNHWLGVYSLEWGRLGQCLHTAALEQSAVSVALSPTARHLAVGLGARRFSSTPARTNMFALLYCLDPLENSSRTGLTPIKELEQTWEHGFTSLNCLRWAPQPGQGLVYANNTGQLIIMS